MSAQTARDIAQVEAYVRTDGEHRCKVTLATGEVVALGSLTRPELLKAAKMAFPSVNGKALFKVSNSVIRDAIRASDQALLVTADGAPTPDQGEPAPKAAPKATPKSGDATADALAALLASLTPEAPALDVDQVTAIVRTEVAKVAQELPGVVVEVKGPLGDTTLPETHHESLPEVVTILGAGLNLFLVGPAGSGKSTLIHQAAEALSLDFHALSLGPTTPTSKLFGYMDAQGRYVRTPFREAYENGGVILLDELDNGHPGLVAEINQATANGYCAFADGMVKRHPDCRIAATGNTFGRGPDRLFVGRNILDAATLDRFATVEVLVDERLERAIALAYAEDDATLRRTIGAHVDLVQATRAKVEAASLPLVVSPRASIDGASLIRAGVDPKRAAEVRLYAGWSTEHRSKAGIR